MLKFCGWNMWLSENKFTVLGSNPIGDAIFILNLRSSRENSKQNSIKYNVAQHCGP